MGAHAIGKWGRREGETRTHDRPEKPKQKKYYGMGNVKGTCFMCGEDHLFVYPCARLAEYQADRGIEISISRE